MSVGGDAAVWLYGSHARGDADAVSDVDVLLVSDSVAADDLRSLIPSGSAALSVAQYSWAEIEGMASYGSLFLRHLKLEGRPIVEANMVEGRLASLLSQLGSYRFAKRDLRGFWTVLRDIERSLASDGSLAFELSTLGTVVRHACILGCALSGHPCFSRFEPVRRIVKAWRLGPGFAEEFPSLYAYRLYADGRLRTVAPPSFKVAADWCQRAQCLLAELGTCVDEAH